MKAVKHILVWIKNIVLFFFISSIAMVVLYKFVPVYYTPLMFIRLADQVKTGEKMKLHHTWVPLGRISQSLVQAVVASEDNLFLEHNGFDLIQIQKAREDARKGKKLRGASTISQQTAKNVFLWPGRSFVRKGLEAYFTVLIELIWGKKRIMEVYLNSIETGKGIYGAQAVAEAHFHKEACQLSPEESALIAASLPNPARFDLGKPSAYMLKRQAKILSLMSKLLKIEMGYEPDTEKKYDRKKKKSTKWTASVSTIWAL